MSRTVVGYIPSGYLNSAASSSPTGSVDAETGLPIVTGLTVGAFQEFTDSEALGYSAPSGKTLFGGTYQWVQLDPAISTNIAVGTALYWLQTATGYVVTTTVASNAPDYAGVSIDPNFGTNAYAFIQVNGKATCLFASALTNVSPAYGDLVVFKAGAVTTFDDAEAYTATTAVPLLNVVGLALAIPAASTASLVRITRTVTRF
jgi:hypothetical protein